jgi:C-terminal processing protease CtpA/Prc
MIPYRKILLGAFSLLALAGCTTSGDDDFDLDIFSPENIGNLKTQEEFDKAWEKMNDYQREFEYCYEILDYYYLFAHSDSLEPPGSEWYDRLESRSAYIGEGSKYLTSRNARSMPSQILDIYYMFMMMNDKYTTYVDPSYMTFDEVMDEMNEREPGSDLGILVRMARNGTDSAIVITQILKGSAADIEGSLGVNDTIISMNGIEGFSASTFEMLSTGYIGSYIPVKAKKYGSGELVEAELHIVSYVVPTVTYQIIDNIAVISISEFATENTTSKRGTYGEFLEALDATEGTDATVIDLRGNPGGDGDQCDSVSMAMLPKGSILTIQYMPDSLPGDWQNIIINTVKATEDGPAKDRYLVFVADSSSGSCSEYTLASVLVNRNSPLVGQNTYGKGVGYTLAETYLHGAAIFTITIAYDKNHETFHMHGIEPDVHVDDHDAMLDTALAIAKEKTMTRTAGYGKKITPNYQAFTYFKKPVDFGYVPSRKELGRYKVMRRNIR